LQKANVPMRNIALLASLVLVGCSSSSGSPGASPADAGADVDPATLADAGGPGPDAGPSIPASPAGRALTWVLAALNGAAVTPADVTAHFTPSFVQAIGGAAQLPPLFADLAKQKAWTLVGFDGATADLELIAVATRGDGEYWRISRHTRATGPMDGLLLDLAGDLDPSLATLPAVEQAMGALAAKTDLLAATVDGAACTPIESMSPNASLAIGSAFKLWVLATVAQSVEAGAHAWTDEIAIEDRYKSLPSGTLQDQPAGTKLPLLTFADEMISKSDNTAADHLLFTVGRAAVEAMLTTTGHHDPTANQPFLSTRELFTLKLMLSPADQQAFAGSTVAAKRTLLDGYDARLDPRTYAGPAWDAPILPDTLEWFATPGDLCRVMATLKAYADKPATKDVYDVLRINPGFTDHGGAFAYIGMKGGSEPGVLDMTFLLQRKRDDKWLFLTLGWNDPARPIDETKAVYLATAARAIVGR
jgi:beta-lactamase class A